MRARASSRYRPFVSCPTTGDALSRIACELHQANEGPSLLDRLLDPALLVSAAALVLALASFLLALRQRREGIAREGRAERARLMEEGLRTLTERWLRMRIDPNEQLKSYEEVLMGLSNLNQIGAFGVQRAIMFLDSFELPEAIEERRLIGQHLHFGAWTVYRRWLNNPFAIRVLTIPAARAFLKAERTRKKVTRRRHQE